jgi:lysozyme family protein
VNFDKAFDKLIGHEGGYSNNPADPGGETMYGVTLRVARQNGYLGAMKDMPLSTAKRIAKTEYWDKVRADALPDRIRFDVFDTCYHSGQDRAVKLLQQALGFTGRDVDGIFGKNTLARAGAADPDELDKRFNGYRLRFLASLGTWPSFARGWARRIANNLIED